MASVIKADAISLPRLSIRALAAEGTGSPRGVVLPSSARSPQLQQYPPIPGLAVSPPAHCDGCVECKQCGGLTPQTARTQQHKRRHCCIEASHKEHPPITTRAAARKQKSTRHNRGPEPIPMHCGSRDIHEWFDTLEYDDRTLHQRQQIQRTEDLEAQRLRRHESSTNVNPLTKKTMYDRLSSLNPTIRSDLHCFVTYMLEFGTRNPRDYFPVAIDATPSKEVYMQLRDLFDFLDEDHSGTVSFEEMRKFCAVIGRESFGVDAFRRIDTNRSGSINFLELLGTFFPKTSSKLLKSTHEEFDKLYVDGTLTPRQRLSSESFSDVEHHFAAFQRLEGGCTAENLLASIYGPPSRDRARNPAAVAAQQTIAEIFPVVDRDHDGKLNLDEFSDLCKFCYPPFVTLVSGKSALSSLPWLTRRTQRDYTKVPQLKMYLPRAPFELLHSARRKDFNARINERPNIAWLRTQQSLNPATQRALDLAAQKLYASRGRSAVLE